MKYILSILSLIFLFSFAVYGKEKVLSMEEAIKMYKGEYDISEINALIKKRSK